MKARKKYFEEEKTQIQWKEINTNLVDEIWGEAQP
jgi:Xaa-Pro aminopeptidase